MRRFLKFLKFFGRCLSAALHLASPGRRRTLFHDHSSFRVFPAVLLLAMAASAVSVQAAGLSGYWNSRTEGQTESGSPADDGKQYETTHQYTEDEIFEMNGGDAAMLFTDGYLTFLRGKYYEGTVTNEEEAIESIKGMAMLLGLTKGSEFYAVFGSTNSLGYTTYNFQQRYGNWTLQNAVLKVIVGPDHIPCGLVSSFTPNIGMSDGSESSITSEEALEVVQSTYPDLHFTYYPEATRQTSVTMNGIASHAWAVFTDYPPEENPPEGRAFLEHLVSYDGRYLMYMAVTSPNEMVKGDNAKEELALAWFEGKEADSWTGNVTLHDGSTKEITVPVVKDAAGNYYLADLSRHILLADYTAYASETKLIPWTCRNNNDWPNHYLITYNTYLKIYDFFASYGMTSIDGFGMPLLILTDYCYADGMPNDNACFLGMFNGWGVFGASSINHFGECVDVIGHEFTHGITTYSLGGDIYENESGALNEALSDIVGNLCEMMMGETEDTQWLIGEVGGRTVRSMSFPWLYKQPATVGGAFYQEMDGRPDMRNDFGGVHTNSSLVNYVAWRLCAQGMSLDDSFRLWLDAISLLTPQSGFREIHQALLFAAEMRGFDVRWLGVINMVCEQVGY